MGHQGLAELEHICMALPEEHRAPLKSWIERYVVSCDIGWHTSELMANAIGDNLAHKEMAHALVKLGAEVAKNAAHVSSLPSLSDPLITNHCALLAVILARPGKKTSLIDG